MRRTCARSPGGLSTGAQAAACPQTLLAAGAHELCHRSTMSRWARVDCSEGSYTDKESYERRARGRSGGRTGGREAGARRGRARRNAKESRRARRQVETRYERKDIEGEGWKERKEGRGRGCRGREGREGRARRGLAYRPSHVSTIESCEGAVRRGRRGVSTSTLPLSPAPTRARRRRGQEEGDAPLSFFFSSTKTFSGSVTICVRESCVSSTSPARLSAGARQVRGRGA